MFSTFTLAITLMITIGQWLNVIVFLFGVSECVVWMRRFLNRNNAHAHAHRHIQANTLNETYHFWWSFAVYAQLSITDNKKKTQNPVKKMSEEGIK